MDKPSPTPASSPVSLFVPKELKMPKEVEDWLQTLNPSLFQNYKDIESTWNNPYTQFSVTLVSDPQFRGALTEIAHQDRPLQRMALFEVGLIFAIWILRAWRLSKAPTWLLKLWVQLWVGAVFWLFSLILVPLWVWGSPFKIAVGQFVKALIHHFF